MSYPGHHTGATGHALQGRRRCLGQSSVAYTMTAYRCPIPDLQAQTTPTDDGTLFDE